MAESRRLHRVHEMAKRWAEPLPEEQSEPGFDAGVSFCGSAIVAALTGFEESGADD